MNAVLKGERSLQNLICWLVGSFLVQWTARKFFHRHHFHRKVFVRTVPSIQRGGASFHVAKIVALADIGGKRESPVIYSH